MLTLEIIAERKIEEAIERGEFDDLPGAGRPLDLDDLDPLLPEELRMACRMLKNAGMSTADLQDESAERARARKKLAILEGYEGCGRSPGPYTRENFASSGIGGRPASQPR